MRNKHKINLRITRSAATRTIATCTLIVSNLIAFTSYAQSTSDVVETGQLISVDQPDTSAAGIENGFTLLDSIDTHKDGQVRPTAGAVSGNRSLDKEARALEEAERAIIARGKENAKEAVKASALEKPQVVEAAVIKEAAKASEAEPIRAAVNVAKVAPSAKVVVKPERSAPDRSAEVAQLQRDLGQARRQISDLSADLDKTRARLMTAETEVDRLSALLEGQDRRSAERFSPGSGNNEPARSSNRPASSARVNSQASVSAGMAPANAPQVGSSGELSIVTVSVEKAVVRTAASRDSSPLMALNRGTRLVVESRNGEWLRVLTPSGVRAWVTADAVSSGQAGVNRDTAKAVAADAFGPDGF